jgi:hypothetical protein
MRRSSTRSFLLLLALLAGFHSDRAFQGSDPNRHTGPLPIKRPTIPGKTITPRPKPQPSRRATAAELTINSTISNCQVLLNNQSRGVTNESGVLTLRALKPGPYRLLLRKTGYRDEERPVTLSPGPNMQSFSLASLPGSLIVVPNLAGASIVIRNFGEYRERINMELPPGSYEILVSKPGYRTVTRGVTIKAAEAFNLPVTLEKLSLDEAMKEATKSFIERDYVQTINLSREIISSYPNVPQAYYLLALSFYLTGNYNDALSNYIKVISLDGKGVFQVRHRHNLYEMCTGTITLTKTTFTFQSSNAFGHDFTIPYGKFKEFYVEASSDGVLHTKVRIPKPGGRKGEDEKDYNFYVPEALTPTSTIGCSNCRERMEVINQLLLWAQRQTSGTP